MRKSFRQLVIVLLSLTAYAVSPTIVSRVTLTGELVNVSNQALYTVPTTGLFRASTYLSCATVHNGVCAGSLVEYDYTDEHGTQFVQVTNGNIPAGTFAVIAFHAVAGSSITFNVSAHPDGVNTYNGYFVLERIGD